MTGEDGSVGAAERLHPLFLLTGIGGALRGMAGGYAFIGYLAVSGRLGSALLAAAALLAMTAIALYLHWRRFEFRIGEDEIRIDSGIFSRTHRSIPFDRVQDVEIAQGPVARLLGIAKVSFETGASAGTAKEDGALQAIPLARAEAIRDLVRARRGATAAPAEEADSEPVFVLTMPKLLLAGLFNFSLAIFAGLFGFSQTIGDVAGFDPLSRSFWLPLLSGDNPLAAFLVAHQVAAAAAGLVLLVLIGIATGITRTLLRDFGFRVDSTGSGLRRRRGLLTRSDVTIPRSRAQAAIIATGPVRDHFGWRDVRLQSLARDEGGKGDHLLAPLADDEDSADILGAIGWRAVATDTVFEPVSSAYVWLLASLLALPALAAAILAAVVPLQALGLLAGLAILLALRFLAWRRTGFALDGDRLLVRGGWWKRRLLILPLRRIQSVDLTHSAFSRLFGTASLTFGVAGGSGLSIHHVPAIPMQRAGRLRDSLLSMPQ